MKSSLTVVIALAAIVATGCSGTTGSESHSRHPSPDQGPLTAQEFELASRVAQEEAGNEKAVLTSATALLRAGRVGVSNTGHRCESGQILHIRLLGTFPHITTTGHPISDATSPPEDFTVHAVLLSADPATGDVCLISVQTGDPKPLVHAAVLPID